MNPRLLLVPLAAVLLGLLGWILLPDSEADGTGAAGPEAEGPAQVASAPAQLQGAAAPRLDDEPEVEAEAAGPVSRSLVEEPAAKEDDEPDERRSYRGRVINSDGRGVANAEVSLRPEIDNPLGLLNAIPKSTATTDNLGNYEILGLGKMRLKVEADGYEPYSGLRTLGFSTEEPIEVAILDPGVILHGTVVAEEGGALGGASLFLVEQEFGFGAVDPNEDEPDVVADESGYFEFTRVEKGEWSLAVRVEGRPLRIFQGATDEPGRISPGLRLEIPPGATIAGRVTGLGDRDSEGYRVRAIAAQGGFSRFAVGGQVYEELDAEGRFEFGSLDPEVEYDLALIPDGMSMMRASGMAGTRSEPLTVTPGGSDVELAYLQGKAVRLQLVDAGTSEPVTEAEVRFGQLMNMNEPVGADGSAQRFHAKGEVRFADVHASEMNWMNGGKFRIEVQAPGYVDVIQDEIELTETDEEFDLGVIRLERSPMLKVTVIEAGTGDPIKRAVVRLDSLLGMDDDEEDDDDFGDFEDRLNMRTRKAKTDKEGVALVESFGNQRSRLQVTRSGFARAVVENVVVPASGDELTVEIAREAALQVRVVEPDGSPVGDVMVNHRFPNGETERESVDGRGRLRLRKLEAGTHAFRVLVGENWWDEDAVIESEWREITLAPGADLEFELIAPARYTVTGRVTAAGRPVPRAEVGLHEIEDPEDEAAIAAREAQLALNGWSTGDGDADADGRFELDDILPGEYFLAASRPDAPNATVVRVRVRPGDNAFDVALTGSTVRGRVIDESGRPVVNATLDLRQVEAESEFVPNEGRYVNQGGRRGPGVVQLGGAIGGENRTDSEGRFELLEVPENVSLALFVSGPRMIQARSEPFTVEPDSERELEVECKNGGALVVDLVRPDSSTPDFMRLRVRREGQDSGGISGWSWGGNPAEFDGMQPGRYVVQAFSGGWRNNDDDAEPAAETLIEIRVGEETKGELVVP